MQENQYTISDWSEKTFGPPVSILRMARRAQEELNELISAIEEGEGNAAIGTEIADVIIVLCGLATATDNNLVECINNKMVVNRARKWHAAGSGNSYHIKD